LKDGATTFFFIAEKEMQLEIEHNSKWQRITEESIEDLLKGITESFPDLLCLKLTFSEYVNISDKILMSIGKYLAKFMSLQQFSLKIVGKNNDIFMKITDNGISSLIPSIVCQSLFNLKHLEFTFQNCLEISDMSVCQLTNNIALNLKALESFELNLPGCESISNQSLKSIVTNILSNYENLQSLNLNFDSCLNIKDKGFIHLTSGIGQNSKNLNSLSLKFNSCSITNMGINQLAFDLKKIKTLHHLALSFQKCVIDENTKKYIKKKFENIPSFVIH